MQGSARTDKSNIFVPDLVKLCNIKMPFQQVEMSGRLTRTFL